MTPVLTFIHPGCGDRLGQVSSRPFREHEWLGNVELSSDETYHSCRRKCEAEFPEYQFFQVHNEVNQCECLKLKGPVVPGRDLQFKPYHKYIFGYRQSCGKLKQYFFLRLKIHTVVIKCHCITK